MPSRSRSSKPELRLQPSDHKVCPETKRHGRHSSRTQTAHLRRAHVCPSNHAGAENDVEASGGAEGDLAVSRGAAAHSAELSWCADAGEGPERPGEMRFVSALRVRL